MILCDYGCGNEAIFKFKNGKVCCSDNISKCPKIRKTIGEKSRGREMPQEARDILRKSRLGKRDSEETRRKKSESRKGSKNPSYGKKRSEKTRKLISLALQGRKSHNKLTIEIIKKQFPFFYLIEEMRYNPDKPGEYEIQVHCKYNGCPNSKENGGWFTPTVEQIHYRKNHLEREGDDKSYFYCSKECKQICPLFNLRSDPNKDTELPYTQEEYSLWRQTVLEQDNHMCQICESTDDLHCHHIQPVKTHPHLSLDPTNGIVLCKTCHYKYGHNDECSTGNLANKLCTKKNFRRK